MILVLSLVFLSIVFNSKASPIISIFDAAEISDEIFSFNHSTLSLIDSNIAEDARLSVPELITKYGYNAEIHSVTTEDGYIIELHRIAGGPKFPPKKGKKVCFLVHGLSSSSASWIMSGPHHALGYKLADEGYDVWLANCRGNVYSAKHKTYKPFGSRKQRKLFWSFSWHEIGVYDLPSSIDYILAQTGETKLQYIGHSQGTTVFFVMASEKPEYNDKIEMMHALAPAVFLANIESPPARALIPYVDSLMKMAGMTSINHISPSEKRNKMCRDLDSAKYLCQTMLNLVSGIHSDQANYTLIPIIYGHSNNAAAVKQYAHYGQSTISGDFRKFDYGKAKNKIYYNSESPPKYELRNVTSPVALYYAQSDWLTVVKDVENLIKELPNVINDYLVPYAAFNHVDFISGKDAPRLVYDEIIKTMMSNGTQNYLHIENLIVK